MVSHFTPMQMAVIIAADHRRGGDEHPEHFAIGAVQHGRAEPFDRPGAEGDEQHGRQRNMDGLERRAREFFPARRLIGPGRSAAVEFPAAPAA